MKTLAFTLGTIAVVVALAVTTFAILAAAGADVSGTDCRYSDTVGTTCR